MHLITKHGYKNLKFFIFSFQSMYELSTINIILFEDSTM